MIGVAVQPNERDVAREFFELCKTPWEFYRSDGQYEVLICTSETVPSESGPLVLIFNGASTSFDAEHRIAMRSWSGGAGFLHVGRRLPIYGTAATFPRSVIDVVKEEATQESAVYVHREHGVTAIRIGYSLFEEARFLLTTGQPVRNAGIPALELHIALLRDLITRAGFPLVEIPPVPEGHAFIVCLTHDIDHPAIRRHWCDGTMLGFLYRSTIGSLLSLCRGKKPAKKVWKNWLAAGRLPLVYLGIAQDFWREFDRYLELEAGRHSTFFVIPEKNRPGRTADGSGPARRACRYDLHELAPQLKRIIAAGNEVGLHGLDAWLDADDGRRERERVAQAVGTADIGVRMHWLYADADSPAKLDAAGFAYDSTVGYNETVGYRAGTTQAYRPLGAANLLELPLHVMDTALFYPDYLNLDDRDAQRLVGNMIDDAAQFGGALTINWHDRSIAPERWWDDSYRELLRQFQSRGAWFATAAQAVAWFRKRRRAVVETTQTDAGRISVRGWPGQPDRLPGLMLRVHQPRARTLAEPLAGGTTAEYVDVQFNDTKELNIAI